MTYAQKLARYSEAQQMLLFNAFLAGEMGLTEQAVRELHWVTYQSWFSEWLNREQPVDLGTRGRLCRLDKSPRK